MQTVRRSRKRNLGSGENEDSEGEKEGDTPGQTGSYQSARHGIRHKGREVKSPEAKRRRRETG